MTSFFDDMVEILQPNIDTNNGASKEEWNYGNYVEFPDSRTIEDRQIEELLNYFEIEIPFGEEIYFSAYEVLKNDYELPTEFLDQLEFDEDVFEFPSLAEVREVVIDLLKEHGAPIGETLYEDAGELPEEYCYWVLSDEDSDNYYDQYSIEFVNYQSELHNIKSKLSVADDSIVKKSLLLAGFVYTESFIRSKVRSLLPDLNKFSDTVTSKILKKYFDDKLGKTDGRKELYKKYFGDSQEPVDRLEDIPYVELRNILAHDIADSNVIESNIHYSFRDKRRNYEVISRDLNMLDLLDELETFVTDLERKLP